MKAADYTDYLADKKVLIVGLGASGEAASRLLLNKVASLWITEKEDNPETRAITYDLSKRGVIIEVGRHTEDFVRGKDLVVVSPGVLPCSEIIKWADKYKIPVISELEIASWHVTYPLICVTGTNGKSTVTGLIDHIFKCAGKKSVACGNLGMPLSSVVLNHRNLDVAAVEVSSFQLEYIKDFRPKVSIWLNFSYDHLDHHRDMDEYLKSKLRIFENQTRDDWAIINYREVETVGEIKAKKLIYGKGNYIGPALIKGRHNEENILAAVTCARLFGIKDNIIRDAIGTFKPLSHRLEYVDTIEGVDFIDDSKATNVHAVIPALESFSVPIVLILGGRDKGDDFTRLRKVIKDKVRYVLAYGEARDKIANQLKGVVSIYMADTMEETVYCAFKNAESGMTILLSPGCSSFDMFKDYKERGEKFKEAVIKLKTQEEMAIYEK